MAGKISKMKKIVRMVFGSHMYGLNTPNSDKDYKGIYLPSLDELLLGTYKPTISFSTGNDTSKNTKDDVDDEWMALPTFLKLACKGETVAIDMLHSSDEFWELDSNYGHIWGSLVDQRTRFYTKNLSAYMGYVKRQAAKYGIKGSRMSALKEAMKAMAGQAPSKLLRDIWALLPEAEYLSKEERDGLHYYHVNGKLYQDTVTVDYALERLKQAYDAYGARARQAEKNDGVDWKAVSHALRAGYQLRGILAKGTFSYPLEETDFILKVKTGQLDFKTEVSPVLEALVEEVEDLTEKSTLPEKVDQKYWDRWLLNVYKDELITPEWEACL
jgi:hypothetical protein